MSERPGWHRSFGLAALAFVAVEGAATAALTPGRTLTRPAPVTALSVAPVRLLAAGSGVAGTRLIAALADG